MLNNVLVDKLIDQYLWENEYNDFFAKKMKEYNIKSPKELSDEKKKEFFEDVDKGWKSEKEKK